MEITPYTDKLANTLKSESLFLSVVSQLPLELVFHIYQTTLSTLFHITDLLPFTGTIKHYDLALKLILQDHVLKLSDRHFHLIHSDDAHQLMCGNNLDDDDDYWDDPNSAIMTPVNSFDSIFHFIKSNHVHLKKLIIDRFYHRYKCQYGASLINSGFYSCVQVESLAIIPLISNYHKLIKLEINEEESGLKLLKLIKSKPQAFENIKYCLLRIGEPFVEVESRIFKLIINHFKSLHVLSIHLIRRMTDRKLESIITSIQSFLSQSPHFKINIKLGTNIKILGFTPEATQIQTPSKSKSHYDFKYDFKHTAKQSLLSLDLSHFKLSKPPTLHNYDSIKSLKVGLGATTMNINASQLDFSYFPNLQKLSISNLRVTPTTFSTIPYCVRSLKLTKIWGCHEFILPLELTHLKLDSLHSLSGHPTILNPDQLHRLTNVELNCNLDTNLLSLTKTLPPRCGDRVFKATLPFLFGFPWNDLTVLDSSVCELDCGNVFIKAGYKSWNLSDMFKLAPPSPTQIELVRCFEGGWGIGLSLDCPSCSDIGVFTCFENIGVVILDLTELNFNNIVNLTLDLDHNPSNFEIRVLVNGFNADHFNKFDIVNRGDEVGVVIEINGFDDSMMDCGFAKFEKFIQLDHNEFEAPLMECCCSSVFIDTDQFNDFLRFDGSGNDGDNGGGGSAEQIVYAGNAAQA